MNHEHEVVNVNVCVEDVIVASEKYHMKFFLSNREYSLNTKRAQSIQTLTENKT